MIDVLMAWALGAGTAGGAAWLIVAPSQASAVVAAIAAGCSVAFLTASRRG